MANVPIGKAIRDRERHEDEQRRVEKARLVELMIEAAGELRKALDERPDLPEVLTAAQVTKILRFNRKTFYSRYRDGRIPGCLGVKPLRFSKKVILEWIHNGRPPLVGAL